MEEKQKVEERTMVSKDYLALNVIINQRGSQRLSLLNHCTSAKILKMSCLCLSQFKMKKVSFYPNASKESEQRVLSKASKKKTTSASRLRYLLMINRRYDEQYPPGMRYHHHRNQDQDQDSEHFDDTVEVVVDLDRDLFNPVSGN